MFTKPIDITMGLLATLLTIPSYYLLNLDVHTIVSYRGLFSTALLGIFLIFSLILVYHLFYRAYSIRHKNAEEQVRQVKNELYAKAEKYFLETIIEYRKQGEIDEVLGIIDLFDKWKHSLSESLDHHAEKSWRISFLVQKLSRLFGS